ncbi:prepilin peptidase CpaA [Trinickia symbiotica]|uniref:Peptidase A24 n=1 Tax=Trinickia symbiotica TaxID=863227 RepID=A0A2N7XAM0_9BURK|nr:prepilin peptidase [Trinickia symbiotica]PMS38661.1 peptidase A24 [Trinickia symbiotica]PPK46676.1 prepilin peptidase CpaA [Trinickia symbiotica]
MLFPALPPHPIPLCVAALTIVTASTDITCRRIPNPILALSLIVSLLVQVWLHGLVLGAGSWLAGAMTGFALLIPLYLARGTSAGDVKLLLTIGAWVGPTMVVYIVLATFLIGGVWSMAFVVFRRRTTQLLTNLQCLTMGGWRMGRGMEPGKRIASVGSLPYGVAIAAGTLGVLFASAA